MWHVDVRTHRITDTSHIRLDVRAQPNEILHEFHGQEHTTIFPAYSYVLKKVQVTCNEIEFKVTLHWIYQLLRT